MFATKYNLGKVTSSHMFFVLEDMNMKRDKYRQGKVYVQTTVFFFVDLHLNIILDNDQLDTYLLYFTIPFIIILYMFRTLYAHHQDVELY